MMEMLQTLMTHAVEQYGRSRYYTVLFNQSTPVVVVYEDDDLHKLADIWMVNGAIQLKKYY